MAKKKSKCKCKCKIAGVVRLSIRHEDGYDIEVHPMDYYKFLRQFKYCPLCGEELAQLKERG